MYPQVLKNEPTKNSPPPPYDEGAGINPRNLEHPNNNTTHV